MPKETLKFVAKFTTHDKLQKHFKKLGEKGQVTFGPSDKVRRSEGSNELFSFISLAS